MAENPVKSAQRVIEIFEFFADRQRPSTLMQIARALNYPASSTSAILKSLQMMGYLDYDRVNRTFIPTVRSALLGIWVNDALLGDSTILGLMMGLRDSAHATVVLGTQVGMQMRYIHVMRALEYQPPAHFRSGCARPLASSAVGYVILSLKKDQEVIAITRRLNAEEPDPHRRVNIDMLLEKLRIVRRQGFAYTEGAATPGGGMIAMLLAAPVHQAPMVLGLGGPIAMLRDKRGDFVTALRQTVEQHRLRMEADWNSYGAPAAESV